MMATNSFSPDLQADVVQRHHLDIAHPIDFGQVDNLDQWLLSSWLRRHLADWVPIAQTSLNLRVAG